MVAADVLAGADPRSQDTPRQSRSRTGRMLSSGAWDWVRQAHVRRGDGRLEFPGAMSTFVAMRQAQWQPPPRAVRRYGSLAVDQAPHLSQEARPNRLSTTSCRRPGTTGATVRAAIPDSCVVDRVRDQVADSCARPDRMSRYATTTAATSDTPPISSTVKGTYAPCRGPGVANAIAHAGSFSRSPISCTGESPRLVRELSSSRALVAIGASASIARITGTPRASTRRVRRSISSLSCSIGRLQRRAGNSPAHSAFRTNARYPVEMVKAAR